MGQISVTNICLWIRYQQPIFVYGSDISKWVSSSGTGKSVPITAKLTGAGPNAESIDMEIDYQSFFEVNRRLKFIYFILPKKYLLSKTTMP